MGWNRVEVVWELKISEFNLVIEVNNYFLEEVIIELRFKGGAESNWVKECRKERKGLLGRGISMWKCFMVG